MHAASMTIHLSMFMTCAFWIVPKESAETMAKLSTYKTMWWPCHIWPHLRMACITAYTSLNWMSHSLKHRGHLDEYHLSSNIPHKPLEPLASMYTCDSLREDSNTWTPFQATA